jgi:hypothetical protein
MFEKGRETFKKRKRIKALSITKAEKKIRHRNAKQRQNKADKEKSVHKDHTKKQMR